MICTLVYTAGSRSSQGRLTRQLNNTSDRDVQPRQSNKMKQGMNDSIQNCHPLRRLGSLFASSVSFLRSPTRRKNSTFSKYPPPRLFASSSDASSGSPDVLTCAFQSSADISNVVSFFPFWEPADGGSASCTFGLRRPGRLAGVCVGTTEVDAASAAAAATSGGVSSVDGVGMPEPLSCGTGSSWPFGGFQRGHFLASAESSGTSTTSLSLRSQRLIQKAVKPRNGNAHTTSSPANRCRFSTLTVRLGSLSGGVDGALTESWNLAHSACRMLQPLR